MNVFVDFHHAGLLQSLILLFEGRFKGQVFRPIGMDWFSEGYWKVYDHPATANQFLQINGATPDGTDPLNTVVDSYFPGIYLCHDIDSGKTNRAITFKYFIKNKFDYIVASLPQHVGPFKKLRDKFQPQAKLIYQIGNNWNISPEEESLVDVILSSSKLSLIPKKPWIEYHQEFDMNIFGPCTEVDGKNISSFVNCFSVAEHFREDFELFQKVEKLMSDWNFKIYGGQCRDGAAHGNKQVSDYMKTSRFIWHTKFGGDGYGHVIFNSAAIGRPAIVKRSYYVGKLAEKLMTDGVTCIDIDGLSPDGIVEKILKFNDNERYTRMVQSVQENFKAHVDFEQEAVRINNLLSNL